MIAVVIPAWNAAATIDDALGSVAGQTTLPHEVVVVDDQSTDATAARAKAWADRLPITVLATSARSGPSAARAEAIAESSAPLIAFLDADDVWLPDHLATLRRAYRDDRDLVVADRYNWAPGHDMGARWMQRRPVPAGDQLEALYADNYVNASVLVSRARYARVRGLRTDLWVGEDWDLWIRMVRSGARVVPADHPTVLYRVGPASAAGGERAGDDRVRLLELAYAEARDDAERAVVRTALRRVRAERALWRAYGAADTKPARARYYGLGALTGRRRVAMRGAAMALAPRLVAGRRARAREDLTVLLRE